MAQLIQRFNAHEFDPTQGNPPLPVGRHPVVIADSEVKPTKGNDGGFLELTLKIIDGPAQGQTGPHRVNLYSSSQKAAEIAHRQMSAICHAIAVFDVSDTRVMHDKPFMVDVALQPGEEAAAKGYTQVTKIYDINGNEPGKNKGGQQQQQQQQQPQHDPYRQQMAESIQGPGGQSHQPMNGATQQPTQGNPGWQQGGQQQQAQGGAAAWGQPQPQTQTQQQPQGNAAWGGGQPQQQPAHQPPSGAGGWQQQAQGGGNPGWQQRNN